jgi:hypothetical protein
MSSCILAQESGGNPFPNGELTPPTLFHIAKGAKGTTLGICHSASIIMFNTGQCYYYSYAKASWWPWVPGNGLVTVKTFANITTALAWAKSVDYIAEEHWILPPPNAQANANVASNVCMSFNGTEYKNIM